MQRVADRGVLRVDEVRFGIWTVDDGGRCVSEALRHLFGRAGGGEDPSELEQRPCLMIAPHCLIAAVSSLDERRRAVEDGHARSSSSTWRRTARR